MTASRSGDESGTADAASADSIADGVAADVTIRYTSPASASASDAGPSWLADGAADVAAGGGLRDLLEMYWKSRGAGLGGILRDREADGGSRVFGVVGAEAERLQPAGGRGTEE
jgi:hypothetical protein